MTRWFFPQHEGRLRRQRRGEVRTLFNGGLWLPRSEETNHVLRLGQTGSGKSVTAIIDHTNIYSRIHNKILVGDPPQPEVVGGIEYDDKCENIPELCAIAGEDRVLIGAPFDRRAFAPDLAGMFDTEARLSNLAEVLLEVAHRSPGADPFWINAAQDCVLNAGLVFQKRSGGRWDLRDLIHGTATAARLELVFRQLESTRWIIGAYLRDDKIRNGVLATIRSQLRDFRPIAAIWARIPRKVNLRALIAAGGFIVVLQPSVEKRRASRANNRMCLTVAMETALALPNSARRRLVFGLDEVQELGCLPLLPRVHNQRPIAGQLCLRLFPDDRRLLERVRRARYVQDARKLRDASHLPGRGAHREVGLGTVR